MNIKIKKFIKDNTNKHVCKCGCGRFIIIKLHHYYQGIPEYISGDNMKTDKAREDKVLNNPTKNPKVAEKISKSKKGQTPWNKGKSGHLSEKSLSKMRGPRPHTSGINSSTYKPEIDVWMKEHEGKHSCKCGCGKLIIIERRYYHTGVPEYIQGHRLSTEESNIKRSQSLMVYLEDPNNLKLHVSTLLRYYQNERWDRQVNNFINGDPIIDFIERPPRYNGISQEEYNIWRHKIYKRDNHICQICGDINCMVHAHHIKKQSLYPELVLNINNGITMCPRCHRLTYGKEELFIEELQMIVNGEI